MVPYAGWEMPVQYEGIVAEHTAVRTRAGVFDVSHMGELVMSGPYAAQVVDYLVTNRIQDLEVGACRYTVACNAEGGSLDDLIVYRQGLEKFLIVCNASNREKMSEHFAKAAKDHCEFRDISNETSLVALQGPRAEAILSRAGVPAAVTGMKSFRLADASLAGENVTIARTGYTGEDGFEIFAPWNAAPRIWAALFEAGQQDDIKPCGLGARDTLRLEAKLALYGNELDEQTSPLEAGLGWVVKLDKGDFVGRAALVAQKERGLPRSLVGLEMVGRGIARTGYPVFDASQKERIGHVTSGCPSPTLKVGTASKNIGLAYVPPSSSAIGTKLFIEIRGQQVEATVVRTPFYKRTQS